MTATDDDHPVLALIEALDRETGALLAGEWHSGMAETKAALLDRVERTADAPPAGAPARLRLAAGRNRAALASHAIAARDLLHDLRARLDAVENDGTYRRSDLVVEGPTDVPVTALPPPDESR